jgi:hypothetical protein
MQSQVESEIQALAGEQLESEQTQKTNLEEKNHHKHHVSKKHKKSRAHHKKGSQRHTHSLMQTEESVSGQPAPAKPALAQAPKPAPAAPAKPTLAQAPKPAPKAANLLSTTATNQANFDKFAQNVDVPIDEIKAITLKVSPTFTRDKVESVTLKSFRKVVGYDTFNSILKGDRNEKKDISDHYNVTVSMMIQRIPEETAAAPARDPFNPTGKSLAESLDKGFPYDDGDSSPDNMTPNWKDKRAPGKGTNVGKLNGENVTKEALVNLIKDSDSPITQSLVQLEGMKSDADGLFKLMDANVTRGNLKNLVTDKPAPITVALAQKSDADGLFKLMDANVTRGNLKNLVTDKPAPITVALAQKSDADGLFKLMDANVTRGNLKNLVTDKPAPITVALA